MNVSAESCKSPLSFFQISKSPFTQYRFISSSSKTFRFVFQGLLARHRCHGRDKSGHYAEISENRGFYPHIVLVAYN